MTIFHKGICQATPSHSLDTPPFAREQFWTEMLCNVVEDTAQSAVALHCRPRTALA